MTPERLILWIAFNVFVLGMLALDLGIFLFADGQVAHHADQCRPHGADDGGGGAPPPQYPSMVRLDDGPGLTAVCRSYANLDNYFLGLGCFRPAFGCAETADATFS